MTLAPFAVLASEGASHAGRDHGWHLALADRLHAADPGFFTKTRRRVVDLADEAAVEDATGVKCRGREYLRIIYGPEYTEPDQLTALRQRSLGRKRALALREHGLGLAALDLLAQNAPLWRRHERVFAILACESEPVDPRL